MESPAPDSAARLLTVVDAVAARAEEARRRLDELSATLDDLAGRLGAAPGDGTTTSAASTGPERLAAIEMAVSGATRAQAAQRLAAEFPGVYLAPVLDDVYGPGG
jgi:hypothetical protein